MTTITNSNQCVVYKTLDDGKHWSSVLVFPFGGQPEDGFIHFFNSRSGLVVDASGKRLFVTEDGGASWAKRILPCTVLPNMISFPDAKTGWILGNIYGATGSEAATLYTSSNGGRSWRIAARTSQNITSRQIPYFGDKTGITFKDGSTGWITGTVNTLGGIWIYVTHDGGHHWEPQKIQGLNQKTYKNEQIAISSPTFINENNGVLPIQIGDTLELFMTSNGGQTWRLSGKIPGNRLPTSQIDFINTRDGWVSQYGSIWNTTNDGKTWTRIYRVSDATIKSIDFITQKIGWVIIQQNGQMRIVQTTDGGNHWS
ncbi:MAG: hypothetical protein K6T83_00605 [Alicyclobacillus sp.]|nr:hypothetical protein [Alicyclobacillus sp.]